MATFNDDFQILRALEALVSDHSAPTAEELTKLLQARLIAYKRDRIEVTDSGIERMVWLQQQRDANPNGRRSVTG